jgi:hypothetical protein
MRYLLLAGLLAVHGVVLRAEVPFRSERLFFPALIDGQRYQLEAMLYRPEVPPAPLGDL